MLGILGQVDEFVGVVLQVMKKLVVALVDIADVFETVVRANPRREECGYGRQSARERYGSASRRLCRCSRAT